MRPCLGVSFLMAYDRHTANQGGKRNMKKTRSILYATQADVEAHQADWHVAELRRLCTLTDAAGDNVCLGTSLGGAASRVNHFKRRVEVAGAMHDRLRHMHHTASEHVLAKSCVGVTKVAHLLRSSGEELRNEQNALRAFDAIQDGTLTRLFPGLNDDGLRQASLGAKAGGLGFRRAYDVALPAAIASKLMAGPKVRQLGEDLARAGLMGPEQLITKFEDDMRSTIEAFKAELDSPERRQVDAFVERAHEAAAGAWARLKNGHTDEDEYVAPRVQWTAIDEEDQVEPRAGFSYPVGAENGINRAEGEADGEVARDGQTLTVNNVQKQLCVLIDNTHLRRLVRSLAERGAYEDMRRLQEMRDPSVDHSWLYRLDPLEGTTMPEEDYKTAVQLRLGAAFADEPYECPECGRLADIHGYHSSCCAKAERTKGHYAVTKVNMDYISRADSSATLEERGLSRAEPTARPGDICARAAIPNRDAALDITIASQEASGAGRDCVNTAYQKKLRRYRETIADWDGSNLVFQPMVWSHEGRAHHDVARVMAY
jgi:hypothetical protein